MVLHLPFCPRFTSNQISFSESSASEVGYFLILETLPEVQKLTHDEKIILAEELLDDLNAPNLSGSQEQTILQILNERLEAFSKGTTSASSWEEVQSRLCEKTGASWRR